MRERGEAAYAYADWLRAKVARGAKESLKARGKFDWQPLHALAADAKQAQADRQRLDRTLRELARHADDAALRAYRARAIYDPDTPRLERELVGAQFRLRAAQDAAAAFSLQPFLDALIGGPVQVRLPPSAQLTACSGSRSLRRSASASSRTPCWRLSPSPRSALSLRTASWTRGRRPSSGSTSTSAPPSRS